MYTQRIIHSPALGKNADLRAALEERNSSANAAAPHALSVSMFALEPTFVHAIRFDNLAAIEAYQERLQGDAAFQAVSRKITQCLSRPQAVLLYEELAGAGAVTTTPKFLIRNRLCPAPGKVADLRAVIEERLGKGSTPGLAGAGLSRQVASLDGPAFSVTLLFGSLAEMDLFRAANDKDSSFVQYVNKVASLSRTPVQQRIQRILAPFPARR